LAPGEPILAGLLAQETHILIHQRLELVVAGKVAFHRGNLIVK